DLRQPLDVLAHLPSEVALDDVLVVDDLTYAADLVVRQVPRLGPGVDPGLNADLLRHARPDAVDVAQGKLDPLIVWDIDARDTCHRPLLALALLVALVFTDHPYDAEASDDLALIAARLYRCSNFHVLSVTHGSAV